MWILSRYLDVAGAGSNWQVFSSAKGNLMTELPNRAGATLGTTDPPRHDRLRGLVQHAFMKRNLEALAEPMREIARDAAEALRGRDQFDFISDFSSKFTVRVLFAALGLPMGDEQTVRDKAVLMVQSDPVTRAKGPEHLAAYAWMQDYASSVIAQRRAEPKNDLISHFSMAEIDGDRLDEREVLLTTTTLIMAGIESLGGFMSMLALNLADFADARRAVVADPALLPDAVEESLRYNTSAQRFKRCLQSDLTLHGVTMKAGTSCAWRMARPIATNGSFRIRTCTTSSASRKATSASAAASMPASARRSPGWQSGSRSMNSTRWCRTIRAPSNS